MENNELQKIWKSADTEINQKSKEELNLLLTSVTRHTVNKFLIIIGVGIISGLGLIIYLIITSLNRQDDAIYLINNTALGIIASISIVSGFMSWHKLQDGKFDQPLRNWLEVRIDFLSRSVSRKCNKLYIFLIPVVYVLTVLSIHVYFENKPFIEVLTTKESIMGLIVGTPVGLIVSYIVIRKIRKHHLINLEFLKDLYNRLGSVS